MTKLYFDVDITEDGNLIITKVSTKEFKSNFWTNDPLVTSTCDSIFDFPKEWHPNNVTIQDYSYYIKQSGKWIKAKYLDPDLDTEDAGFYNHVYENEKLVRSYYG